MEDFTSEKLSELCALLTKEKDIGNLEKLKDLIERAGWSCDKMLKKKVDEDPDAYGPENHWLTVDEGDTKYTGYVCGCWRTVQEKSYSPGYSISWRECEKHKSQKTGRPGGPWPLCQLPAEPRLDVIFDH